MHGNRVGRIVSRATAVEQTALTAAGCGLDDVLDRYPHEITAGRRRIAGLARALCGLPDVATVVLEDAPDLPAWPNLLDGMHAPELYSVALLLLTHDTGRTEGFTPVVTESHPPQGDSDG